MGAKASDFEADSGLFSTLAHRVTHGRLTAFSASPQRFGSKNRSCPALRQNVARFLVVRSYPSPSDP
jgi:hypothetical protein